jgi:hypothetical protein
MTSENNQVQPEEIPIEEALYEPVFYKPKTLMRLADGASIAAWVIVVVYILQIAAIVYGTIQSSQPSYLLSTIMPLVQGTFFFFVLKGISTGLYVLMEFELNSRGEE